jgi:hypothetical protein
MKRIIKHSSSLPLLIQRLKDSIIINKDFVDLDIFNQLIISLNDDTKKFKYISNTTSLLLLLYFYSNFNFPEEVILNIFKYLNYDYFYNNDIINNILVIPIHNKVISDLNFFVCQEYYNDNNTINNFIKLCNFNELGDNIYILEEPSKFDFKNQIILDLGSDSLTYYHNKSSNVMTKLSYYNLNKFIYVLENKIPIKTKDMICHRFNLFDSLIRLIKCNGEIIDDIFFELDNIIIV